MKIMNAKIIRELSMLFALNPTPQKNYVIVHSLTVKTNTVTPKGKQYKIVCQSQKFTKEEILQLSDKQALLLEQILKFRKLSKKIDNYEKTINSKTI